MIKAVLDLFKQPTSKAQPTHRIELATAALMAEVVRADHQFLETEQTMFKSLLIERFALHEHEVDILMDEGHSTAREAVDLVQFTQVINQQCSEQEKVNIVKLLWQIANADSEIAPLEEHIIRRIADLLYVGHSQFIKAKLDVLG